MHGLRGARYHVHNSLEKFFADRFEEISMAAAAALAASGQAGDDKIQRLLDLVS